MALIPCPACSHQISDQAKSCPQCGHPINAVGTSKQPSEATEQAFNKLNQPVSPDDSAKPQRVWSGLYIVFCMFLFGMFLGGIMSAVNWQRMGRRNRIWLPLISGFIGWFFVCRVITKSFWLDLARILSGLKASSDDVSPIAVGFFLAFIVVELVPQHWAIKTYKSQCDVQSTHSIPLWVFGIGAFLPICILLMLNFTPLSETGEPLDSPADFRPPATSTKTVTTKDGSIQATIPANWTSLDLPEAPERAIVILASEKGPMVMMGRVPKLHFPNVLTLEAYAKVSREEMLVGMQNARATSPRRSMMAGRVAFKFEVQGTNEAFTGEWRVTVMELSS